MDDKLEMGHTSDETFAPELLDVSIGPGQTTVTWIPFWQSCHHKMIKFSGVYTMSCMIIRKKESTVSILISFGRNNKQYVHTSERKEWKYPLSAYLEAEYTAWPGAGVFPAALLIWQLTENKRLSIKKHEMGLKAISNKLPNDLFLLPWCFF